RLAAANGTSQSFGVTRGRQASKRDAGIGHVLLHLLEVAQLFARKARQAIREIEILRVREDEAEGGRGRLLLAIRMIEKQLLPALARDVEPLGIGRHPQRRGHMPLYGARVHVFSSSASMPASSAVAEAKRSLGVLAIRPSSKGCNLRRSASSRGRGEFACMLI